MDLQQTTSMHFATFPSADTDQILHQCFCVCLCPCSCHGIVWCVSCSSGRRCMCMQAYLLCQSRPSLCQETISFALILCLQHALTLAWCHHSEIICGTARWLSVLVLDSLCSFHCMAERRVYILQIVCLAKFFPMVRHDCKGRPRSCGLGWWAQGSENSRQWQSVKPTQITHR